MEDVIVEKCQTCLRPINAQAGAVSQWQSICRCQHTYSPNSQYSIPVCLNCKKRIATIAVAAVGGLELCSCEHAQPAVIANYLKPNEKDSVELELASVGLSADDFPVERYQPVAILALRAKAVVVLARDKQRGVKVAVKCFKQLGAEAIKQFEQEAKNVARLSHNNIARLIDYGLRNKHAPYTVTEYKDGFSLDQYLALRGTPSHDVAVSILLSVGEALVYANKQGFLHRNIKPGNIIFVDDMNSEPSIVLTDFSLGKLKLDDSSEPADAFYLSGDETRGLDFDERSQIYSLGCVGFALLTGGPPFSTGSYRDIKNKHSLELPPQIASLNFDRERPRDLEEVIERCLEKDPRNRFDSVAKLVERLEVFPRRQQARIANLLAARKRQKILRIVAIGLGAAFVCAIGYYFCCGH